MAAYCFKIASRQRLFEQFGVSNRTRLIADSQPAVSFMLRNPVDHVFADMTGLDGDLRRMNYEQSKIRGF